MSYSKYITTAAIALLLSMGLVSCGEDFFTTTVELEIPKHKTRLVVHAFNLNQSRIVALVTKSLPITDGPGSRQQYLIDDAQVKLYKNDQFVSLFAKSTDASEYNYVLDLSENIEAGAKYTLQIEHDTIDNAQVSTVALPQANIIEVAFQADGGLNDEGESTSAVEVTINDPADEENYYEVALSANQPYDLYISSIDPSASRSLEYKNLLVSDATFDGERKTFPIQISPDRMHSQDYTLYWRQISKAQYVYSKAMRQSFDQGDNPFASPIQLNSTVENGFGFFGLQGISVINVPK